MFNLIILTMYLAIFYGWISNIVMLFQSSIDMITGEIIIRVVGIFLFPLGGVMGYVSP